MAAATAVAHLFKQGDHVIISEDCYGGVFRLFNDVIRHFGIEVSFTDLKNLDGVQKAIRPNTKCIWAESPSNPLLRLVDINALAEIANSSNALLVVDNTFCSPILQKPLDLGAHIVVHSLSKYVNGHSDVLGGAVITKNKKLGDRIHFLTNALGIGSPAFDSWLILRGIKTLKVRYSHQQKTTQTVAEWLQDHLKVKRVIYPGLPSHPDHELAKRQQKGFGAVITFEVDGGKEGAKTVAESTEVCTLAESLGGVTTLIELPAFHSHASMTDKARQKAGINDALIRLSIGLEDENDLINDLGQALRQLPEMNIRIKNHYNGSYSPVSKGVLGV
jgi:cystathionine beta-lyase/cystathionine gamma-synthase